MMKDKAFAYSALITGALLMIPFLMMKFHIQLYDPGSGMEELSWTSFDFIAMGTLIFSTLSLFVISSRLVPKKYRFVIGIFLILAFLWLWAELAVGIFTDWGS